MPTNKPEVVLPDWAIAAAFRELDNCQNHSCKECGAYNEVFNRALELHRADTLTRPAAGDFVMVPREPTWIVNDIGELGVMVDGVPYFLYKGDNIVYHDAVHDDGSPMLYRIVGKREFGEVCHPLKWVLAGREERRYSEELVYTPGLSFGRPEDGEWRQLPMASRSAAPQQSGQDGECEGWEVVVTGWTKGDGKTLWLENDGEPMFRIGARGDMGTNKAIHLIGRIPSSTNDAQQPAEAVAVDLEQFREAVEGYRAIVSALETETNAKLGSLGTAYCDRLLAIIDSAPPAIDIGKLRGAVETLNHAIATQFGARVTIHATRARQIRDELAALIGDGEKANG